MKPTEEQQAVIDMAKTGVDLAVCAFAGAAKTTTLRLLTKDICTETLYIAFNKAIAEEARVTFPPHVTVKTINGIAWQKIIGNQRSPMAKKMNGLLLSDIERYIADTKLSREDKLTLCMGVLYAVTAFCHSADNLDTFIAKKSVDELPTAISKIVRRYWADLIVAQTNVSISHDVYLKIFQLTHPNLGYSLILLDEAQDSNAVTLDIFYRQQAYGTQLILVGDKHQSIYGFRGASNALDTIPPTFARRNLTMSFRFTQDIADIATALISHNGEKEKIRGFAKIKDHSVKQETAIICRTNLVVFRTLFAALDRGDKVHLIAELGELKKKFLHVECLLSGRAVRFPDPSLVHIKDKEALLRMAKKDITLQTLLNLTLLLLEKGGVYSSMKQIEETTVSRDQADIILVTAHKSKGLEFDVVILEDDFLASEVYQVESYAGMLELLKRDQTLELIYVALTRAKSTLQLPANIRYVINFLEQTQ